MSSPLTLAQVREIAAEWEETIVLHSLCATIEWLAERVDELDCDTCSPDGPLGKWLRGEA